MAEGLRRHDAQLGWGTPNSPLVFSLVACTSGCTVGPFPCAYTPGALCVVVVAVVVVLVGALVGYFLAALPAAFAPLEADEPMTARGYYVFISVERSVSGVAVSVQNVELDNVLLIRNGGLTRITRTVGGSFVGSSGQGPMMYWMGRHCIINACAVYSGVHTVFRRHV